MKFKKAIVGILSTICLVCLAFGFAGCGLLEKFKGEEHTHTYVNGECTRCQQKKPSEDLEFKLNDDGKTYSLTGLGTCTDTDVVIPSLYNDLPVTSIGDWAFEDCTILTSVVIGENVTTIGEGAFLSCENLTSFTVDANNSVYKSIDGNLYSKDDTILLQYAIGKTQTMFTVPDSVTAIGEFAFVYCEKLTNIIIPDSVTSIGESAFSVCENLTSVELGENVTTIGDRAFYYCTSLTSIIIPDGVTTIGRYAFSDCYNLTSIIIPDSVTTIGKFAFGGCYNLTIYCEAEKEPSGWDSFWNSYDCSVVWGYTGD